MSYTDMRYEAMENEPEHEEALAKQAYQKQRKETARLFAQLKDNVQYILSACIPRPDYSDVGDLEHLNEQLRRALYPAKDAATNSSTRKENRY